MTGNPGRRTFVTSFFLLIAGTYTPFTLGTLRGAWGWTLFGLVWSLAVLGITLTAVDGIRYPRLSSTLYVGMGWLALNSQRGVHAERRNCSSSFSQETTWPRSA